VLHKDPDNAVMTVLEHDGAGTAHPGYVRAGAGQGCLPGMPG